VKSLEIGSLLFILRG